MTNNMHNAEDLKALVLLRKVDEKTMIRNRNNRIPHPSPVIIRDKQF